MQKYVPEANDQKGSVELGFEVVAQVLFMFIGLFFINRVVTFLPTYSGEKYKEFNMITIILSVLMIITSLQTKLGEKISILTERVLNYGTVLLDQKRE
jgi:hypothetical protein